MNVTRMTLTASCALAVLAGSASAGMINATITADNHYALFADSPSGIVRIGGNEIGASGSPGRYNWSLPESWTFEATGRIYIAVWSDDVVAQGLLADIRLPGGQTLHTGDSNWSVYVTGQSKASNTPWPLASEITSFVSNADSNELWTAPYVGATNQSAPSPWGGISGIDASARWTWGNPRDRSNPLLGGNPVDNYQIFSIPVPGPGGVTLAAVALAVFARRRR